MVMGSSKVSKLCVAGTKRPAPEPSTVGAIKPPPKPSVATQQQQQQQPEVGVTKPAAKPTTSKKTGQPVAKATSKSKLKQQPNLALDEDSDDDFLPGTLKPVVAQAATPRDLPTAGHPHRQLINRRRNFQSIRAGMYLATKQVPGGAGRQETSCRA